MAEQRRRGGVFLSWPSLGFVMAISFIAALAVGQPWMAIALAGSGAMILILKVWLNMRKGRRLMVGGMESILLLALFAAAFGVTGVGVTASATGSVISGVSNDVLLLTVPLVAFVGILIYAKTRRRGR